MAVPGSSRPPARPGAFTLFEVAVSLLVVLIAITSSLLVFPIGLKSQQEARFRIVAAAHFQSLLAQASMRGSCYWGSEGRYVDDRPYVNGTPWAPDLDGFDVVRWHGALAPVPDAIAKRLDSEDDEIARLLAEGGQLYYSPPTVPTANYTMGAQRLPVADEAQKLVVGIIGHPQQNALAYHPQVKWPYLDPMPSDYIGSYKHEKRLMEEAQAGLGLGTTFSGDALSNDLLRLRTALGALGLDTATLTLPGPTSNDLAAEYLADGLKYCARAQVLRWWAHASGRNAKNKGIDVASYPAADADIKEFQTAMAWAQAYDHYLEFFQPYDFRVTRDCYVQTFTQFPLLQFDVMATPLKNPLGAPASGIMHAWPLLASRDVTAISSSSFDNPVPDTGHRATASNWNLTRPFAAAERCREVVYWAVDWLSYEDCESAPAAPNDASLFSYLPTSNQSVSWNPSSCAAGPVGTQWAMHNNWPECPYHWTGPDRTLLLKDSNGGDWTNNKMMGGSKQNTLKSYLGRWGADRNGNGRFDRGTISTSVRLRAVTIARFTAYDPRLWTQDQ